MAYFLDKNRDKPAKEFKNKYIDSKTSPLSFDHFAILHIRE